MGSTPKKDELAALKDSLRYYQQENLELRAQLDQVESNMMKMLFQAILDVFFSSRDAIFLLKDDHFVDSNDVAKKLFLLPEKIAAYDLASISTPLQEDGSSTQERLSGLMMQLRRDGACHFEWVCQDTEGRAFDAAITMTELYLKEELLTFVMIHDITVKKKLQREKEEMQLSMISNSKLATLGEMASGIAHEINNPLAIISGYTKVIQQLLNSGKFELGEIQNLFEKISNMAKRIAQIVQGLRMFSRDSLKDQQQVVEVDQIIEQTLVFCEEKFKKQAVSVSVEGIRGLKICVQETQISQVVLNLLSNAYDAVELLPEKWIRINTQKEGDWIKIRIIDSGPGIPPETLDKIMRPFFTTKEVGRGTGLGLSISHQIIRDHGGELTVDSSLANTCFVISLPAA